MIDRNSNIQDGDLFTVFIISLVNGLLICQTF